MYLNAFTQFIYKKKKKFYFRSDMVKMQFIVNIKLINEYLIYNGAYNSIPIRFVYITVSILYTIF